MLPQEGVKHLSFMPSWNCQNF